MDTYMYVVCSMRYEVCGMGYEAQGKGRRVVGDQWKPVTCNPVNEGLLPEDVLQSPQVGWCR